VAGRSLGSFQRRWDRLESTAKIFEYDLGAKKRWTVIGRGPAKTATGLPRTHPEAPCPRSARMGAREKKTLAEAAPPPFTIFTYEGDVLVGSSGEIGRSDFRVKGKADTSAADALLRLLRGHQPQDARLGIRLRQHFLAIITTCPDDLLRIRSNHFEKFQTGWLAAAVFFRHRHQQPRGWIAETRHSLGGDMIGRGAISARDPPINSSPVSLTWAVGVSFRPRAAELPDGWFYPVRGAPRRDAPRPRQLTDDFPRCDLSVRPNRRAKRRNVNGYRKGPYSPFHAQSAKQGFTIAFWV